MDDELFEQLKARYRKAKDYFDTKFSTDTEDNRQKAIKAFQNLEKQIDEVWKQIKYKTLEFNDKSQLEEIVEQAKEQFYMVRSINCYKKSRKMVAKLERPEFWKYASVLEE